MGHVMLLGKNGWLQSIPCPKKHRNTALICHSCIHLGFIQFLVKIPTPENGCGLEMGYAMVLGQNRWLQSIPCPKKHRNRALICHSCIHLGFIQFLVTKFPCPKMGVVPKWVMRWFQAKIDGCNRFLAPKNIGIEPLHDKIVYSQDFYNFMVKFPHPKMGVAPKWVMRWSQAKMDGCNRFLAPKNIGIEYPHAIVAL